MERVRGLLKCGHCGSNMIIMQSWKKKKDGTKTRWNYLKCSQYRRSNDCVNHVPITYEHLRHTIIQELKKESDKVNFNLEECLTSNNEKKIKQLERKMEANKLKKTKLLDVYLEGIIDKVEYEEKRENLIKDNENMEDQIFLLSNQAANEVNIKYIQEALDSLNNTKQDLFHVFQILIEKGIIYEDGQMDLRYSFSLNHS